jgi:hypothetical protein
VELGDALIAASAVAHGAELNRKHYPMREIAFFEDGGIEPKRAAANALGRAPARPSEQLPSVPTRTSESALAKVRE